MLKKSLKKFLLLFVIFISLISCATSPEIIYRDPVIIIPNEISSFELDDTAPITANEYKLIIQNYRWRLLYYEISKNAKKISEEKFNALVTSINMVIDLINLEIEKLENLDQTFDKLTNNTRGVIILNNGKVNKRRHSTYSI